MFGQFDVPFGIAYYEYPSVDHRFVTTPAAVEEIDDSWNDLGGQIYMDAGFLKVVMFGTNGFSYAVREKTSKGEKEYSVDTSMALGGRAGIKPVKIIETGASGALFFNSEAKIDMVLAGADLSVDIAGLAVRAEYLYQNAGIVNDNGFVKHGFYAQTMYDFDPVYIIGRYSSVFEKGNAYIKQLSGGFGVKIIENGEIRFEISTDMEGIVASFIQLAGGMSWMPTGFRR
jgi:hypothetical protein